MAKTKRTPTRRRAVVQNGARPKTELSNLTTFTAVIDYPYVSGNGAVRHGPRGHKLTDLAKAYRWKVAAQIRSQGLALNFGGPLRVDFQLLAPDGRARDADNAMKCIKDALTKAEFWVDDSNKVIRAGSWEWGARPEDQPAQVVVTVRGYSP